MVISFEDWLDGHHFGIHPRLVAARKHGTREARGNKKSLAISLESSIYFFCSSSSLLLCIGVMHIDGQRGGLFAELKTIWSFLKTHPDAILFSPTYYCKKRDASQMWCKWCQKCLLVKWEGGCKECTSQ